METWFWNEREHRLRAFWRLLMYAELYIALMIIFSVALGLLWVVASIVSSGGYDAARISQGMTDSPVFLLASSVGSLLATLLCTGVAGRFLDRRPLGDFGFHFRRDWWLDFGAGLALGALLMAAIFATEWALGWISVAGLFQTTQDWPFPIMLLVYVLLFLCVGIYEELLFRGYFLRNLAEGLNLASLGPGVALLLAWIGSSLVFGAAHLGNPGATFVSTVNIALAGIFLGMGYMLTGELAFPIGLHIAWNFFQGTVFGFPVSGTTPAASLIAIEQGGPEIWTGGVFGPEAGILGIIAMIVGSLLTWLWVRYRTGQARLQTRLAVYGMPEESPSLMAELPAAE